MCPSFLTSNHLNSAFLHCIVCFLYHQATPTGIHEDTLQYISKRFSMGPPNAADFKIHRFKSFSQHFTILECNKMDDFFFFPEAWSES